MKTSPSNAWSQRLAHCFLSHFFPIQVENTELYNVHLYGYSEVWTDLSLSIKLGRILFWAESKITRIDRQWIRLALTLPYYYCISNQHNRNQFLYDLNCFSAIPWNVFWYIWSVLSTVNSYSVRFSIWLVKLVRMSVVIEDLLWRWK